MESPYRWLIPLVGGLALIFALTAEWGPSYNVDAYTNALQARGFAANGSPVLEGAHDLVEPEYQGQLVWVMESPRGPAAQYPPGTAVWAAPFYLFDTSLTTMDVTYDNNGVEEPVQIDAPALAPATVAAVVSVAVAMLFFGMLLARQVNDRRVVIVAVLVAALGTGAWSVASNMLWQHGPAMMGIAAGTYFASRDKFVSSGFAFGITLLIRPHTALIGAAVGLWCAWRRRSLRPVLAVGLPSLVALLGLVLYNDWLWGEPSISGGYGDVFSQRATDGNSAELIERLFLAVFDPDVGFAVSSPFLLLGLVAMVKMRRAVPDWSVGAALGGVAYLIVQYKVNRVSGGEGFFSYRYPLEGLMAMAPMMALALHAWIAENQSPRKRLFLALAGASIAMHAVGAITT
jgi:hypothetical protein